MDADTTTPGTGGALGFQRTLCTGLFGKVNHAARHKRHFLRSWTANELPLPIQDKGLLVKVCALANRPGFAIHLQIVASLTLASGALAGVRPTARMRPVSKSWSTWRL